MTVPEPADAGRQETRITERTMLADDSKARTMASALAENHLLMRSTAALGIGVFAWLVTGLAAAGAGLGGAISFSIAVMLIFTVAGYGLVYLVFRRATGDLAPPGATLRCTVDDDGGLHLTTALYSSHLPPGQVVSARTCVGFRVLRYRRGGNPVVIPEELLADDDLARLMAPPKPPPDPTPAEKLNAEPVPTVPVSDLHLTLDYSQATGKALWQAAVADLWRRPAWLTAALAGVVLTIWSLWRHDSGYVTMILLLLFAVPVMALRMWRPFVRSDVLRLATRFERGGVHVPRHLVDDDRPLRQCGAARPAGSRGHPSHRPANVCPPRRIGARRPVVPVRQGTATASLT